MNDMLKLCLSLSLSGSILILVLFLCRPLFKSNMSKVWQWCGIKKVDSLFSRIS